MERTVDEINAEVERDSLAFIASEEERYAGELNRLAEQIIDRRTRVVLLAGPSSSGKTTTANMLADTLRHLGHAAIVISLDDFYRSKDDKDYPLNANGTYDYEAPEALRIDLIRHTIRRVLRGEPVPLPRYDFKIGQRFDNAVAVSIPTGGCAIIEGLHALNPAMMEGMPMTAVTRVFVSVSTNITKEGRRILSGRKIRFIRRMTRDYLYRASDVQRTLSFWGGVLRGEDKYLYPYKDMADFHFDTFHAYELGVMKPFSERVIQETQNIDDPYLETVSNALNCFTQIPLDAVPVTSLIREFLPGGIYEDLY